MARLSKCPFSTQHLLCLMEEWFDRSQPIVAALASFTYAWAGDGRVGCPFCGKWYDTENSNLIIGGIADFDHEDDCPALLASALRGDMLA